MLHKLKQSSCMTFYMWTLSILSVISVTHWGHRVFLWWVEMLWWRKAVLCIHHSQKPPCLRATRSTHRCAPPPRLQHEKSEDVLWRWLPFSLTLSTTPQNAFQGSPQSNNCCILLQQREMGSERLPWMLVLTMQNVSPWGRAIRGQKNQSAK